MQAACYSYNSFSHSRLGGISPYALVFGREPPPIFPVPEDVEVGLAIPYEDYFRNLKARFKEIGRIMLDLHTKQQRVSAEASKQKIRKPALYSLSLIHI